MSGLHLPCGYINYTTLGSGVRGPLREGEMPEGKGEAKGLIFTFSVAYLAMSAALLLLHIGRGLFRYRVSEEEAWNSKAHTLPPPMIASQPRSPRSKGLLLT